MKKITRKNARQFIEEQIKNKKYEEALDLQRRFKRKGFLIGKSTIKSKYKLKDKDIEQLHYNEAPNPYYRCAGNMRLYLIAEGEDYISKNGIKN